MKMSMTIVKKNNTHDMKTIKKLLGKLVSIDEENNIEMSLKPHTMILKMIINCKAYQYYFDLMSAFISNPDYYIQGIGNCLLKIIDQSNTELSGIFEDAKKKYKIKYSIDGEIESKNFIIFPIKVNVYAFKKIKTSNDIFSYETYDNKMPLLSALNVSYDYENKDFDISVNCSDKFKMLLIHLLLRYNAGRIKDGERITISNSNIDESIIPENRRSSSYLLECTYAGNESRR